MLISKTSFDINGNISHSTLALSKFKNGLPVGYSYGYDQLNRLLYERQHNIGSTATAWSNSNVINDYKENISYDANGNILTYLRYGTTQGGHPLGMDNLTYHYFANSNKLRYITDAVAAGNYPDDLNNQSSSNYAYDSIGNLIKDNAAGISNLTWTAYGKPDFIQKSSGTNIWYGYDGNGNRVIKGIDGSVSSSQYYVRDAQGNILAVYISDGSGLKWVEQDLYGSSRIGILNWNKAMPDRVMLPQSESDTLSDWYMAGSRDYELTNHLGNVLSVITDKKVGVSSGGNTIDYYKAEVLSQSDYYPFGMQQPERHYTLNSYKYGFNGKEDDSEIPGWQNYGMREYDRRTARFISVDPITGQYPELTPYQFASNTPIWAIDLDGLEKTTTTFYYKFNNQHSTATITNADINVNLNLPREEVFMISINNKKYKANSYQTFFGRDMKNNFNGNFTGITTLDNSDLSNIMAYSSFVINYIYYGNVEEAALQESNAGTYKNKRSLLDFKNILYDIMSIPNNNLINIEGTVYNPNEIGNYLWGMSLTFFGSFIDPKKMAEAGSLLQGQGRHDEQNEQTAILAGQIKSYKIGFNKNNAKIFNEYKNEFIDYLKRGTDEEFKPSNYLGILKEFKNDNNKE